MPHFYFTKKKEVTIVGTSDIIANFIFDLLRSDGSAEIGRNELAGRFNVVPSQINYVIASRFTPELGYIIESRRGGGGYIRIRRIQLDRQNFIMHIVNSIGGSLDNMTAAVFLKNMVQNGLIDQNSYKLLCAAMKENTFMGIPPQIKDRLRAAIFKNMLMSLI